MASVLACIEPLYRQVLHDNDRRVQAIVLPSKRRIISPSMPISLGTMPNFTAHSFKLWEKYPLQLSPLLQPKAAGPENTHNLLSFFLLTADGRRLCKPPLSALPTFQPRPSALGYGFPKTEGTSAAPTLKNQYLAFIPSPNIVIPINKTVWVSCSISYKTPQKLARNHLIISDYALKKQIA